MSKKIAKTLHLTAGQWKTLSSLMSQPLSSSEDDSVLRVGRIVQAVARGSGTNSTLPTLGELRLRGVRMPNFSPRLDGVAIVALVQGDETDGGVRAYATCEKTT